MTKYRLEHNMIEKIEDIKEMIEHINIQSQIFSIESFYRRQIDGAVCVITPNQVLYAYSLADHYDCVKNIYKCLYGDNFKFKFGKDNKDDKCWQFQATSKGNIIIQFNPSFPSLLWFPDELVLFQLSELIKIYDIVEELNEYAYYQGGSKIEFKTHNIDKNTSDSIDEINFDREYIRKLLNNIIYDETNTNERIILNENNKKLIRKRSR